MLDQRNDTLLSGGDIYTRINMLKLLSQNVTIGGLEFEKIVVHLGRKASDSAFNFQFIADAFSTGDREPDTVSQTDPIQLPINHILLNDVRFTFKDKKEKQYFSAQLAYLLCSPNQLDLGKSSFGLNDFVTSGFYVTIVDSSSTKNKGTEEKILLFPIIRPSQFMEFYLPGYPTGVTLKEDSLILPIGKGKLSPVAIDDVAKACFKIMTEDGHKGKIYEMTGPDAFDMYEACEIISAATGLSIAYKSISLNDYAQLFEKIGLKGKPAQILLQLSKERAKCTESHIHLGTHKLMRIRPTNFAEFIYRNRSSFTNVS